MWNSTYHCDALLEILSFYNLPPKGFDKHCSQKMNYHVTQWCDSSKNYMIHWFLWTDE